LARRHGVLGRGALAGAVAGTVVVLWFLAIDLLRGLPLRTPTFLAGALFGAEPGGVGIGRIVAYTALHYALFILLGIAMAALLRRVALGAGFFIGIVVGFLLFDIMFYVSVAVTGTNVVLRLGWPAVLAGSVLAGIALVATLRMTGVAPPVSVRTLVSEHPVIRDGVAAGLIGAAVVAAWFLLFDLAFRRAFFTPAALGSAIFYGATGPAQVDISIATVLGYTVLHVFAFVIAGLVSAAFFAGAERYPPMILGFILVLTAAGAYLFGTIVLFGIWILEVVGAWVVAIGGILGMASIIAYLWHEHPRVILRIFQGGPLERPR